MLITPLRRHVASLRNDTESMHEYIPAIYIHSCTQSGRKSFTDTANRTPPTPIPTPPPQAHDTVNVWQWRAIGNNHHNKNSRQDGCGDFLRSRSSQNIRMTVLLRSPPIPSGSLLHPRYINVNLKGASAPNLSAAVRRIKSAGRLTSEVTTPAIVANMEWSKTKKKNLKH